MKKNMMLLMIVTVLSILSGFVRELILANFFGASSISDAYIISLTIPQTIFGFVGACLSTTFIPVYRSLYEKEGTLTANRFTSNLMNLLLVLSVFLIVIVFSFTAQIVKVFAAGFDEEVLSLAVTFTRISVFGVFFSGLSFVISCFLQSKSRFLFTGLMSVPLNIVNILSIYLGYRFNIYYLVVGSVVAFIGQLLFLIYDLRRSDFQYYRLIDFSDVNIKKLVRLAVPALFGNSIYQLNVIFDRTLASGILAGGISILSYSERVTALVYSISSVPIFTVMYPYLSAMIASKNQTGFKIAVNRSIVLILILVIPASVGTMVFSREIITLLYGRGEFDASAIDLASNVLVFYAIGNVGTATRDLLHRSFYAMQETKIPAINSGISLLINIVLNIILSSFMGLNGLALATSIAEIIASGLQFYQLRKKVGPFGLKQIGFTSLRIILAAVIMGVSARWLYDTLVMNLNELTSLFIAIICAILLYCGLIYLLKVEEMSSLVNELKLKFKMISK